MVNTDLEMVIDADGHIQEDDEGIRQFMPAEYQGRNFKSVFPPLDHFHRMHLTEVRAGKENQGRVGPAEWISFLKQVGIDSTVLYPTQGLAYGKITSIEWAIAATRAYNDWLDATYCSIDPRFKGMSLIPLQDPEAAVAELRRTVEEQAMLGAMLPTRGLSANLGAKVYWPVYKEADRLSCAMAIHGGCHDGMGFDDLNRYAPIHAMGHPMSVMISFASIIFNGILDRFPNMRMAFLEGGIGWFVMAMERFDRSHLTHIEHDPKGEYGPHGDEKPSDYILRHIKEGRLFIGCEGGEPALAFAANHYSADAFLYSSDFPHEPTIDEVIEEIGEVRDNRELSTADKEAILHKNALRFYGL
jgi:predicted TIM-barrel fold metal-dependent hydrolase